MGGMRLQAETRQHWQLNSQKVVLHVAGYIDAPKQHWLLS